MSVEFDSKIRKVYDRVIDGVTLTDSIFSELGLTDSDINNLCDSGVIILKNDFYGIDINKFARYLVHLYNEGEIALACKGFKRCFLIAPRYKHAVKLLLLAYVASDDYKGAYDIIINEGLIEKVDPLYLYLLGRISSYPKELWHVSRKISRDGIMFPDRAEVREVNKIRELVWHNKLVDAKQRVDASIKNDKNPSISIDSFFTKILLEKCIERDNINVILSTMAGNGDYVGILKKLIEIRKKRDLTYDEDCIILVANALVEIMETRVVPRAYHTSKPDVINFLIANKYAEAQRMVEVQLRQGGGNDTLIILQSLLRFINKVGRIPSPKNPSNPVGIYDSDLINAAYGLAFKIKCDLEKNLYPSVEVAFESLTSATDELVLLTMLCFVREYCVGDNTELGNRIISNVKMRNAILGSAAVNSFVSEVEVKPDGRHLRGV